MAKKKGYFIQTLTIKKATQDELKMIRRCIRTLLLKTDGATMALDQPSPTCGPGEKC